MFIILVWIWGSENKVVYIKIMMDKLNFKVFFKKWWILKIIFEWLCYWLLYVVYIGYILIYIF